MYDVTNRRALTRIVLLAALPLVFLLGIVGGIGPATAAGSTQTIVSLTFDDDTIGQYGTRSILASHAMHATFFVNSGTVGTSSAYMTWSQLHDLAADGNEITGHTVNHANLVQVELCRSAAASLQRPGQLDQPGLFSGGLRVPLRWLQCRHRDDVAELRVQVCANHNHVRFFAPLRGDGPAARPICHPSGAGDQQPRNAPELCHQGRAERRRLGSASLPYRL